MVYRVSHFNMGKLQIAVLQDESSQLQGPLLSLRVRILCTITSFDPRVRSWWQSCLECLDRNANCICYQRATLKYNPWTECTCYVFAYLPTSAIFAILCLRVCASESCECWPRIKENDFDRAGMRRKNATCSWWPMSPGVPVCVQWNALCISS